MSRITLASRIARTVVVAGLCVFAAAPARATNLVVNGSFESGNTGFSSDYTYLPTPSQTLMDAGEYGVIQSLDQAHAIWAQFGSLSAQSGTNYFVANGSPDDTLSPWMQTVSVGGGDITTSSGTAPVYYRFQAYIASVYPGGAQPQLAFEMSLNNSGQWQELTTSVAPEEAYNWYLTYSDGYFASLPSALSFRLRNTVTDELGNDLAVDSIYFGLSTQAPDYGSNPINSIGVINGVPVPEIDPAGLGSVAALITGALGLLERRRLRTQAA